MKSRTGSGEVVVGDLERIDIGTNQRERLWTAVLHFVREVRPGPPELGGRSWSREVLYGKIEDLPDSEQGSPYCAVDDGRGKEIYSFFRNSSSECRFHCRRGDQNVLPAPLRLVVVSKAVKTHGCQPSWKVQRRHGSV